MSLVEKIMKEAKQVGDLYHYTDLEYIIDILKEDSILTNKETYNNSKIETIAVSTTRNKNFNEKFAGNIKITLDGDKLSHKYKIKPFSWRNLWKEEQEERIIVNQEKLNNITQYIKEITILTPKLEKGYESTLEKYHKEELIELKEICKSLNIKLISDIKIINEAQEETMKYFSSALFNRYGFIQRDVTKFISMKDKRKIIDHLEKLRLNSGEGLPKIRVKTSMLIATQKYVDTERRKKAIKSEKNPFVVKLNGVYYLLDGTHRTTYAIINGEKEIVVNFLNLNDFKL